MLISLRGKTALVCGSTQGIGKAIAMQMAASGATVILAARSADKLQQVLDELPKTENQKHDFVSVDFNDTDALSLKIKEASSKYHIDILVNNTGGPPAGPITKATTSEFETAFRQHLLANHTITTALLDGMFQRKFGRIINIISTSVKIPLKGLGVSNTIRGAVANWSKTLANETAAFGITVNNILPGATRTERLKSIIAGKSDKLNLAFAEVENEMLHEIPAGRFGLPEEPAWAAVFLASEFASYITGTNIVVDGGRTANL